MFLRHYMELLHVCYIYRDLGVLQQKALLLLLILGLVKSKEKQELLYRSLPFPLSLSSA